MLRIAEARQLRGWSQDQLAAAIGTTQQTIQRWETGQVSPKVDKILAISEALGVTVSYVMGMEEVVEQTHLTRDEQQLVSCYRNADETGRRAIMAVAATYAGMGANVPWGMAQGGMTVEYSERRGA